MILLLSVVVMKIIRSEREAVLSVTMRYEIIVKEANLGTFVEIDKSLIPNEEARREFNFRSKILAEYHSDMPEKLRDVPLNLKMEQIRIGSQYAKVLFRYDVPNGPRSAQTEQEGILLERVQGKWMINNVLTNEITPKQSYFALRDSNQLERFTFEHLPPTSYRGSSYEEDYQKISVQKDGV